MFSKGRAYEAARRLEQMGRSGGLHGLGEARAEMEAALAELADELRRMRDRLS
jgi:hypothetical protein